MALFVESLPGVGARSTWPHPLAYNGRTHRNTIRQAIRNYCGASRSSSIYIAVGASGGAGTLGNPYLVPDHDALRTLLTAQVGTGDIDFVLMDDQIFRPTAGGSTTAAIFTVSVASVRFKRSNTGTNPPEICGYDVPYAGAWTNDPTYTNLWYQTDARQIYDIRLGTTWEERKNNEYMRFEEGANNAAKLTALNGGGTGAWGYIGGNLYVYPKVGDDLGTLEPCVTSDDCFVVGNVDKTEIGGLRLMGFGRSSHTSQLYAVRLTHRTGNCAWLHDLDAGRTAHHVLGGLRSGVGQTGGCTLYENLEIFSPLQHSSGSAAIIDYAQSGGQEAWLLNVNFSRGASKSRFSSQTQTNNHMGDPWLAHTGESFTDAGAWATATGYTADTSGVTNGGRRYLCTANHTSGASTEPGVGASWQTVWQLLPFLTIGFFCAEGNTIAQPSDVATNGGGWSTMGGCNNQRWVDLSAVERRDWTKYDYWCLGNTLTVTGKTTNGGPTFGGNKLSSSALASGFYANNVLNFGLNMSGTRDMSATAPIQGQFFNEWFNMQSEGTMAMRYFSANSATNPEEADWYHCYFYVHGTNTAAHSLFAGSTGSGAFCAFNCIFQRHDDDGTLRNLALNFPNVAATTATLTGGGRGNAFRKSTVTDFTNHTGAVTLAANLDLIRTDRTSVVAALRGVGLSLPTDVLCATDALADGLRPTPSGIGPLEFAVDPFPSLNAARARDWRSRGRP